MNTNTRTIHTHMYTQHAADILNSVIGQWSDGIWENSHVMEKYWQFANVDRAYDNEVLLKISLEGGKPYGRQWIYNGFFNMTDDEILKFFAKYAKSVAKTEIRDDSSIGNWKRDNEHELAYVSRSDLIKLNEVYALYDFLLGRIKRCNVDIVGTPASAEQTAINESIALKKKLITEEYSKKMNDLEIQKKHQIEDIEKQFSTVCSQLLTECQNKLAEVKA